MASGLKVRDNGYEALMQRAQQRIAAGVKVGIFPDVAERFHAPVRGESVGGATIGEIATWAEFGTSTAPARLWLSGWFEETEQKNIVLLRKLAEGALMGKILLEDAMELLGERCKFQIVRRIGDGIPPANAPSTIARKGSSLPLVDGGEFRQSIDYRVGEAEE